MKTVLREIAGATLAEEHRWLRCYRRDGYIIRRQLLSPEEVNRMRELVKRMQAEAAVRGSTDFQIGGARYQFERLSSKGNETPSYTLRAVKEPWPEEQGFREVTSSPKILNVVRSMIGPEIYYHSSKLMFKAASGGRRKPWHQDWAYWQQHSQRQVTVWFAIDEATRENGCIEVIPGSHKKGLIEHYHGEDYMIREEIIDRDKIVYAEMAPGDVLFFDVLTLHASGPNNSDKRRLCAIIDFDSEAQPEGSRRGSREPLRW